MARSLRVQFEGALYHVSVHGNNRQPIFKDDQDREHYLELLDRYRKRFGCLIYAYILFNCHLQVCFETPKGNISRFMQCLGTSYAAYFNRKYGRRGAFFEGRFRSRLLVKEKYLLAQTRYLHRYVLQKGLKVKGKDYLWSSYPLYLGKRDSDLLETTVVLSQFGDELSEQRSRYQEFVENGGLRTTHARDNPSIGPVLFPGETNQPEVGDAQISKQAREALDNQRVLEIIQGVSISLGMNGPEDLKDKRRNKSLARHVAMYIVRRQTPLPLRSIGALLGVKAPAVALAIGKVELLWKKGLLPVHIEGLLRRSDFADLIS